jgi:membrane fusion protein (multidrug efflux system)
MPVFFSSPSPTSATPPARRLTRAAALAALVALAGCGGGKADKAKKDFPVPVEMATVEAKDLRETLSLVGTLQANESVILKAEIEGQIASIHFDEGEHVTPGKLLIQLDDTEMSAELREAEAELAWARGEFGRRQNLFGQKVVSERDLDRARADLDRNAAHAETLKARLAKTRITAPFGGIMGARRVSPGDVLSASTELVNIESIDPLKLDFEVPERYIPLLAVNQTLNLRVTAFPDRRFPGIVYFIDPRVSSADRSVPVKARVQNPEEVLRPGMYANVELVVQEKPRAVTIPEQALIPQGDQQFVFRVKKDGAVELVPVRTGIRSAGSVEILDGLVPGDRVVSAGHQKIGPGSHVVPFGAPPPGAPPTAGKPAGNPS